MFLSVRCCRHCQSRRCLSIRCCRRCQSRRCVIVVVDVCYLSVRYRRCQPRRVVTAFTTRFCGNGGRSSARPSFLPAFWWPVGPATAVAVVTGSLHLSAAGGLGGTNAVHWPASDEALCRVPTTRVNGVCIALASRVLRSCGRFVTMVSRSGSKWAEVRAEVRSFPRSQRWSGLLWLCTV